MLTRLKAFFLVFITPLSLPIAIWQVQQGLVGAAECAWFASLYLISGFGITLGYHRLVAHLSFDAKPLLKRGLLIAGALAMQGPPSMWVALHRQHHRYTDNAHDPHAPCQDGFWYAHCGWFFNGFTPDYRRFGRDLLSNPEVLHVSRYYLWYSLLGLVLPFVFLGWTGLIWGGLLRLFITSHLTWAVNSVCHLAKTKGKGNLGHSRNDFFIALFTLGEGWHKNHHANLQDPFFGKSWYQIDAGKWLLKFFAQCGLVWHLRK